MNKYKDKLIRVFKEDLELLQNSPKKFWRGIKYIEANAFLALFDLENIIIPESIVDIGEYAFSSCYNLKNSFIAVNAYQNQKSRF